MTFPPPILIYLLCLLFYLHIYTFSPFLPLHLFFVRLYPNISLLNSSLVLLFFLPFSFSRSPFLLFLPSPMFHLLFVHFSFIRYLPAPFLLFSPYCIYLFIYPSIPYLSISIYLLTLSVSRPIFTTLCNFSFYLNSMPNL